MFVVLLSIVFMIIFIAVTTGQVVGELSILNLRGFSWMQQMLSLWYVSLHVLLSISESVLLF